MQNPIVLPFKKTNETSLANSLLGFYKNELLEFFVELIFIWPTVILLGVKEYIYILTILLSHKCALDMTW